MTLGMQDAEHLSSCHSLEDTMERHTQHDAQVQTLPTVEQCTAVVHGREGRGA